MQSIWSGLTPFEKTAVVAAVFELALFIAVLAVSGDAAGYVYMAYWLFFGAPSLCLAPLLFRWFKYREEQILTQGSHRSGPSSQR